ncbi:hypothetical protein AB4Z54_49010, partial [Streptomyces sp. MCAF7]
MRRGCTRPSARHRRRAAERSTGAEPRRPLRPEPHPREIWQLYDGRDGRTALMDQRTAPEPRHTDGSRHEGRRG